MKLWIIVVTTTLCVQVVISKSVVKNPPKKATAATIKPTKTPKSAVEEFTALPQSDVDFIKELDKQFKLHGDKIKFKVERDNTTTNKNSKRTIDGSLGYGYGNQAADDYGFQFSKPRYMIYPYSQHDIPPPPGEAHQPNPQYGPPEAHVRDYAVQIQPSQAFEIKETRQGYEDYEGENQQQYVPQYVHQTYLPVQHQQQEVAPQYVEPVIVLRIPGPAKYAAHLQALLQQYLEIRAAQYLRAIQESEAQQQHPGPQYLPVYQQQAQHQQVEEDTGDHQQQQQHVIYQPIEQVYASVHYNPEEHSQQHYQQQYQTSGSEESEEPQTHQAHHQQQIVYEQQEDHASHSNYQHQGSAGYSYRSRPIYVPDVQQPQDAYGPPVSQQYASDSTNLPISENYPSHKHTKVVFTGKETSDHSTSYPLPPLPTPPKHYHHYQHEESAYQRLDQTDNYATEESVINITQRPRGPYNYHAHTARSAIKGSKRNAPLTTITPEERYKKLDKLVTRIKKKTSIQPSLNSKNV